MNLRELIKSISAGEWRLVAGLCLAILFIAWLPLAYGFLITPANQVFTGIHFTAPDDWFVYYSYIEQGRQGKILFNDLFTADSQLSFLNIFWLPLGLAARYLRLTNNVIALNWVKIVLVPVFFFVAYLFLSYLFSDRRQRKIAIALLAFSSGLGIFLLDRIIRFPMNFAFGQLNWPMDLWVPESNTFLTLYYSPHFIASLTLLLSTFFFTLLFVEHKKYDYSIAAGISAGLLLAFHPFYAPTIFGVIGAYFVGLIIRAKRWQWPLFFHTLILSLLSLPALSYYFYLLRFDLVTQQRAIANDCPTTPLWLTLVGYGLLLVFAIIGANSLFKKNKKISDQYLFIIVWAIVGFCLIYAPVNWQRRLTEGLHFPLVVLTAIGLFYLGDYARSRVDRLAKFLFNNKEVLTIVGLIFLVTSNLFCPLVDMYIYQSRSTISYLPKDLVDAGHWLAGIPGDKAVLNAPGEVVNVLPSLSGHAVYAGHSVETPNFKTKREEINWFFLTNRPTEIERNFLQQRNIGFILYGEQEKKLGDFQPENKPYLQEVYSNQTIKIYQVLFR